MTQQTSNTITGTINSDTLSGTAGNDYIEGGAGYDELYGLEGNDTLDGGLGGGYLDGGLGQDLYIIRDRVTWLAGTNQPGDQAIIYADWYKTADNGVQYTWAPGVQKLPYWIDALTYDHASLLSPFSSGNVIKYSFVTAPPAFFDDTDKKGFKPFTAEERVQTRKILDYISSMINVRFVETEDASGPYTIAMANNTQEDSGGYAGEVYPYGPSKLLLGDDSRVLSPSLDDASTFNEALIHELGHTLGLKHPFGYPDAFGHIGQGPYLPDAEERESMTMMSYNRDLEGPIDIQFRAYDMAALQYIWGVAPTFNAGDSTYELDPQNSYMLWDGGGLDTIDLSDITLDSVIDLRPGYRSHMGPKTELFVAPGQFTINFGTIIETAWAGSGNDTLIGNDANNFLMGEGGNDTIDGGAGKDTAYYWDKHSAYKISHSGDTTIISGGHYGEGKDTLTNIERLNFADCYVALDTDGVAGEAYRIYKAAFDRTPDKEGLGYWIKQMDQGVTLNQVALSFLQSSEFQTLYGKDLSNTDLLDHIYRNVLHRAPDKDGFAYWMAQLDKGIPREALLASFSESAENHAALVGVMQQGIEYAYYNG